MQTDSTQLIIISVVSTGVSVRLNTWFVDPYGLTSEGMTPSNSGDCTPGDSSSSGGASASGGASSSGSGPYSALYSLNYLDLNLNEIFIPNQWGILVAQAAGPSDPPTLSGSVQKSGKPSKNKRPKKQPPLDGQPTTESALQKMDDLIKKLEAQIEQKELEKKNDQLLKDIDALNKATAQVEQLNQDLDVLLKNRGSMTPTK